MEKQVIGSLNSYQPEPVSYRTALLCLLDSAPNGSVALAFAHVLNLPESEDVWPGEAAIFFPELFAVAPYGDEPHIMSNDVHYHMRHEIGRMMASTCLSAKKAMEEELQIWFDRYGKGPSPKPSLQGFREGALPFDDGDDGEIEPDTLNSELLLTQEYVPPQDVPDAIGKAPPFTLPGEGYPTAGSLSPTEKED